MFSENVKVLSDHDHNLTILVVMRNIYTQISLLFKKTELSFNRARLLQFADNNNNIMYRVQIENRNESTTGQE